MTKMTFKKLTSLLLIIAMLGNLSAIAASENEEKTISESVANELPEIDVTTADYPIIIGNRINTARLVKYQYYSKLSDEDKKDVCDYYGLPEESFIAAEKAGYKLLDSARIIKAANAAEISPAEYKEYVEAYGSEEEASFQLQGYGLYENKIEESYKEEFEALMKEGYDVFDLRSTYNVAEYIGTDISSILPSEKTIQQKETATEFEKYAKSYFCDAEKLETIMAKKGISQNSLVQASTPQIMQTGMTELAEISDPIETTATTSSSTSDDLQNSYLEANKHEFISAPSMYLAEKNELVSGTSGGLSYRADVLDFEGKNGLNVDLDIMFVPNSNMYYGLYRNRQIFDWYNLTDVDQYPNDTSLGVGWYFNLPYLTNSYEKESLDEDAESVRVLRYHSREGGAYKIVADDDGDIYTMTLEDYPRDDIDVLRINTGTSRYRITFANGNYQIIDKYGRMTEEGDRFGNKITYQYYIGYGTFYEGGLKKITDTLGREFEFFYQMNPSGYKDAMVQIGFEGTTLAQISLSADDTDEPYMLQWMKVSPGRTIFTYACDEDGNIGHEFVCTDQPFFSPVITTADGMNAILNLSAITYDTGLTSRYTFEEVHVNNGVGGVKKVLRVDERYESLSSADVTDPDDVLKLTTYEYGDDYSGYSKRITAPSTNMELYADPNELPEDFTYHVSKIQNGVEIKTTYNNEHLPIKTETIIKGETAAEDAQYAYEDITYDQYELPIKREKYVGDYIESTEQFEYDSKGNLIKSWSVYADGEKNDEYATVYTYDSTYNLPLSVTYKRDADTTVVENYTLSTDKKTVTEKTVSENGALKEKTQYTYDTYGNVTKERKYKNATQYIDINYDYTDTTGVTRPSNTAFSGAYLTKMWQSGGLNIDGNAIGNVEYTYQYDDMGNRIKETDPLGNTTQYQYDDYRRVKKITNPAGKTKSFAYTLNTTANTTTYTDEAGTQLKYIYDPAHNLLDILDIESGESLASYDYDQWYRKVAERNVQLETSGFETTYTYDIFNRVTQKETKSSWPYVETVAKETYSYDDGETSPYIITTQTIVGDNFAPSIVNKEYTNAYGNVEKIGYVTGNNEYFTTYEYDYLGAKTEELAAIADQKNWTNEFTTKWDYDYAGRVLRQYNANNNYISYEYDWLGRVTKAYDAVANTLATPYYTAYLYDDLGNVIQETVPQTATTNKVTKYKYDKLRRMTLQRSLYDIVDDEEIYHTVGYSYDWRGNVTVATQDVYPTTYTYDILGRLLTSTTNGKTVSYTYDRFGNVLTETFGGKTDTYEYDMNNFRIKHTDPSGKRMTYEPNAIGQTAAIMTSAESGGRTFEYTMTGQLMQASDATYVGRIRREYDDRGNVIYEENTGMTKEYTYDISGKRESMLAKSGGTTVQNLSYTYNNLEQMTSGGGATYQYDANGNITRNIKTGIFGDICMNYTYNRDGVVKNVLRTEDWGNETPYIIEYGYTYYLNGNLKSDMEDYKPTKYYSYNSRNMLECETLSSGKTTTYQYDASGNRTRMIEEDFDSNLYDITEYAYDNRNQLVERAVNKDIGSYYECDVYTYDNSGNLLRIEEWDPIADCIMYTDTFAYNGYGEMSSSTVNGVTTNYTYYADGLRRTKTTNSVTTVHMWDGDNIIADTDGNYALTDSYIRGVGGNLEIYENDFDGWMCFSTIHGDIKEVMSIGMGVSDWYTYDAYGNITDENAEFSNNPFRYSGEYYDEETGFIYLRARYYDPTIGRFTTEDPIRDGLNWYAYCENNPVNRIDPSGESWQDIIYGIAQAMDDNNFGGAIGWVNEKLIGNDHDIESQYDYYSGRVIGDTLSVLIGGGATGVGITEIVGSIVVGGGITVTSSGALAVGGISIAVEGVASGTVAITYGVSTISIASKNFGDDYSKLNSLKRSEYKKPISGSGKEKATDVPSWAKGYRPYKGEDGKNFAKRLMNEKYGKGNWNKSSREFSQIQKWGDRGFK